MTSDEIQNILAKPLWKNIDSARHELWLAEIAYQLAVMNERHAEREAEKRYVQGFENGEKLAQRLGSPVGADSDKPVRGDQSTVDSDRLDWIASNSGSFGYDRILGMFRIAGGRGPTLRCAIDDGMRKTADERTTRPESAG